MNTSVDQWPAASHVASASRGAARGVRAASFGVVVALALGACLGDVPAAEELEPPLTTAGDSAPSAESESPAWELDSEAFATGFLDFPLRWDEDLDVDRFDAGFSMYVAAWPFQETYPGPEYQSGLPSTWLTPSNLDTVDGAYYSTIEGGLGWWNDTRFATEAPKFIMGGVSRDFFEWANGPGAGSGSSGADHRDWEVPQGKYGVAQLSPHVLWPPDGLNLDVESNGELFGYGYHPLGIIDARVDIDGAGVVTGDRSWTLFLNTSNFAGPVTFFIPDFFSKPILDEPDLEGLFFDSSGTGARRSVAQETQVIPAVMATSADGETFVRITRTQFPATDADSSVILNQVASYSNSALRTRTSAWFDGFDAVSGEFDTRGTTVGDFDAIDAADASTYTIIYDGVTEAEEYPLEWEALAVVDVSDPLTFRYRWNLDLVERDEDRFVLPEYYRLVADGAGGKVWRPVVDADVPASTKLSEHEFMQLGERNDAEPYETPVDDGTVWLTPGPTSGPFEAELGDGSVVTYSWYRFVDQPAIRHWGFSEAELASMQARVEQLHRQWGPDQPYLASPTVGELAALDAGVLVTPPAGLEVGYVPIVTRQALVDS
ncbi:MAG: hypothetical protein AB8G14_12315 [Ilumatobacter sp.]